MRNALFLSVDRGMFAPAVFAAHTARANARAHPFDIIIAVPENNVEAGWIDWAETNVGVQVKQIGFSERLGFEKTANRHIPPSTCYRYFFDHFISADYDRLVYLDADVRVTGDVSLLFGLDLEGHMFAACPDGVVASNVYGSDAWTASYMAKLGWDPSVTFANAGVLVIDPRRWLEKDFGRRVMTDLREHLDAYPCVDQDALNLLVRGAFQPISPLWNMPAIMWFGGDLTDVAAPAVPYRDFFRSSPWPELAASLWHERPTWKECRRYFRRLLRRKLLGKAPAYHASNVKSFKDHVRSFDFADKRQGLVAFDAGGVLRPVNAAAPAKWTAP